jgi:hypothetical protein
MLLILALTASTVICRIQHKAQHRVASVDIQVQRRDAHCCFKMHAVLQQGDCTVVRTIVAADRRAARIHSASRFVGAVCHCSAMATSHSMTSAGLSIKQQQ